ncbi:dihydrofolate reductase family protein [Kribbella sandramycini]
MSADGFIAGPGGDMQWMRPYLGANAELDALVPQIGAILAGRRSHDGDDPHKGQPGEGEAFGGGWDGPEFVLTHRIPANPNPWVTFVDQLPTAITAAAEAAGDKYVNVIGADVARQCLEAGALDEVLLIVAPVFLGAGTRVFAGAGPVRLARRRVTEAASGTNLWFDVL